MGALLPRATIRAEQAHHDKRSDDPDADDIDTERPPAAGIAASADAMDRHQGIEYQRQNVQAPPQLVADDRAQPGADADGETQIETHDAEGHPLRAIRACERYPDFGQAEMGERIYPDRQYVHADEDQA